MVGDADGPQSASLRRSISEVPACQVASPHDPLAAYEANPSVRWMFEDDLSQARSQGLFTSLLEFGVLRSGQAYVS
jgi:hypothetical protein